MARQEAMLALLLAAYVWLAAGLGFNGIIPYGSAVSSAVALTAFGSIPFSIFFALDALRRGKEEQVQLGEQDRLAQILSFIALILGSVALVGAMYMIYSVIEFLSGR